MSSTQPQPTRLLRLLGDVIGLAAGVVIAVLSLHDPSLTTTGLGIGLASVSGAHLEEDLNLSGA
jgi:hypothetical protein